MAAPVKAFIDPTAGPLRVGMSLLTWFPATIAMVLPPMHPSIGHCVAQKMDMVGLAKPSIGSVYLKAFQLPPPPMGMQKAVSFPAVYKSTGASRPANGQLWPRTR